MRYSILRFQCIDYISLRLWDALVYVIVNYLDLRLLNTLRSLVISTDL